MLDSTEDPVGDNFCGNFANGLGSGVQSVWFYKKQTDSAEAAMNGANKTAPAVMRYFGTEKWVEDL